MIGESSSAELYCTSAEGCNGCFSLTVDGRSSCMLSLVGWRRLLEGSVLILRLLLHGTCIWLRVAALHDELSKLTRRTLHLFTAGCRHRCGDTAQVSLRKLHWMLGIDNFCSCVLSSHVFLVLLV